MKSKYEEAKELVNEAGQTVEEMKNITYDQIISSGYNPDKVYSLSKLMYDKIKPNFTAAPSLDEDETKEESEVAKHANEAKQLKDLVLTMIKDQLKGNDFERIRNAILFPDRKMIDYDRDEEEKKILQAFDDMLDYVDTHTSYAELKDQVDTEQREYLDYINSKEYYDKKQEDLEAEIKKLEKLEAATGKDRDITAILKLRKKVAVDKGRWDLSFINDAKATPKNTVDVYFNKEKSTYVTRKYYDKCNQIHLNADVFRYFMNLEEKYLDEKYHPFNNLFLFRCMRYIGTLDVKDSEYQFRVIVGTLTKLVYDKFPTEEAKAAMIHAMETYLDQFIDAGYTDLFKEQNISYPKHPERIKKDEEREKSARLYYYKLLTSTPHDASVEDLDAMSIPELAAYAEKVVKEAAEKAKEEEQKDDKELVDKITGSSNEEDSTENPSNEEAPQEETPADEPAQTETASEENTDDGSAE